MASIVDDLLAIAGELAEAWRFAPRWRKPQTQTGRRGNSAAVSFWGADHAI